MALLTFGSASSRSASCATGIIILIVIQHDDGVIRREHLRDRVGIRERVGDLGRQLQDVRPREQQHERRRDRAAPPVAEAAERREHALRSRLGVRGFFIVLRTTLSPHRIRPGSTVNTHSRLRSTPLASTMPRSMPILKRMNTSISKPTIVVTELPVIEPKAAMSARVMALSRSSPLASSCR